MSFRGLNVYINAPHAIGRIKADRVARPKLVNIRLGDLTHIQTELGTKRRNIPETITKLFHKLVTVNAVLMEDTLLCQFCYLAGLARQPDSSPIISRPEISKSGASINVRAACC